jgi:hypothetical protein
MTLYLCCRSHIRIDTSSRFGIPIDHCRHSHLRIDTSSRFGIPIDHCRQPAGKA